MTTAVSLPTGLALSRPEAMLIVDAQGIDRRAGRMLLPDTPDAAGWSWMLVAKDARSGSILGAAKAMPLRSAQGRMRLRVAIHVPRPHRRRGVGSALADRLKDLARAQACDGMVSMPSPGERDEAMPFAAALGFHSAERMTTFEARLDVMAPWLAQRVAWLRARGDIPVTAQIVPLPHAPLLPVAEIHAQAISGSVPELVEHFTRVARGPDSGASVVLLVDGVVRGFHQCEYSGDLGTTHALAVTQDLRGGSDSAMRPSWAGLLLLADRIEEGVRRGIVRARFSCLSTVKPTLRMASLFRAEVVEVAEFLELDLRRDQSSS